MEHPTAESGAAPDSENAGFTTSFREFLLDREKAPRKETDAETRERAERMVRFLQEKKVHSVWLLFPGEACAYSDFLILGDVEHERHRDAVLDALDGQFSRRGEPFRAEKGSLWTLVDFNSVVIHLFLNGGRSLYRLEDLFPEAPMYVLDEEGRLHDVPPEKRPLPHMTDGGSRRPTQPLRHPSV
jgi:ribosome-associated protein|uniref:RsfS/YbeB/iojap family protein n=1 Tax=Leptospirillum ferriphilum TaxID=178606 RepID=A0A7C3LTU8_9BACT